MNHQLAEYILENGDQTLVLVAQLWTDHPRKTKKMALFSTVESDRQYEVVDEKDLVDNGGVEYLKQKCVEYHEYLRKTYPEIESIEVAGRHVPCVSLTRMIN